MYRPVSRVGVYRGPFSGCRGVPALAISRAVSTAHLLVPAFECSREPAALASPFRDPENPLSGFRGIMVSRSRALPVSHFRCFGYTCFPAYPLSVFPLFAFSGFRCLRFSVFPAYPVPLFRVSVNRVSTEYRSRGFVFSRSPAFTQADPCGFAGFLLSMAYLPDFLVAGFLRIA